MQYEYATELHQTLFLRKLVWPCGNNGTHLVKERVKAKSRMPYTNGAGLRNIPNCACKQTMGESLGCGIRKFDVFIFCNINVKVLCVLNRLHSWWYYHDMTTFLKNSLPQDDLNPVLEGGVMLMVRERRAGAGGMVFTLKVTGLMPAL